MLDRRGIYKLLPNVEDREVQELRPSRPLTTLSISSRPCRIFLRIVFAVALVVTFFFGLTHTNILYSSRKHDPNGLAEEHLRRLESPLAAERIVNQRKVSVYVVGGHHPVAGRISPDFKWVDSATREPFKSVKRTKDLTNSAMARMPAGSPYEMMVVGRGKTGLYLDWTEGVMYANLTVVGFFANYDPVSGSWIRVGPEPYILDLPVWRQYPRPCKNLINGGPADPRVIWSDAGEPLAVIGISSQLPGVCKAVGLADLRAIWPGLKDHLEEIGYGDIPIRFDRFTEISKVGPRARYEKNWAAFFPGPKPAVAEELSSPDQRRHDRTQRGPSVWPYFTTQIYDRTIVKINETQSTTDRAGDSFVPAEPLDLVGKNPTVEDTYKASSKCVFDAFPRDWSKSNFHLATPFHRVTFCPRNTCEPNKHNTVLLGLVHYKASRISYRRMFVTTRVDSPFQIISVSQPLHFGSPQLDKDIVFSVSMAFMPTKESYVIGETPFNRSEEQPGGWLSHGWLDDTIVVGAGLRDEAYDAIHLPVETALQGHTLCG